MDGSTDNSLRGVESSSGFEDDDSSTQVASVTPLGQLWDLILARLSADSNKQELTRAALRLRTAMLRGAGAGLTLRGGLHLLTTLLALLTKRGVGAGRRRTLSLADAAIDTLQYTAFLGTLGGVYVAVDESLAAALGKQRCVVCQGPACVLRFSSVNLHKITFLHSYALLVHTHELLQLGPRATMHSNPAPQSPLHLATLGLIAWHLRALHAIGFMGVEVCKSVRYVESQSFHNLSGAFARCLLCLHVINAQDAAEKRDRCSQCCFRTAGWRAMVAGAIAGQALALTG